MARFIETIAKTSVGRLRLVGAGIIAGLDALSHAQYERPWQRDRGSSNRRA